LFVPVDDLYNIPTLDDLDAINPVHCPHSGLS
jgi:hypothetical protein